MFVIEKKRKKYGTLDLIVEVFAGCIVDGSLKPIRKLYRKGRYGKHGCLYGSYKDYRRYCEKLKERKEVTVIW